MHVTNTISTSRFLTTLKTFQATDSSLEKLILFITVCPEHQPSIHRTSLRHFPQNPSLLSHTKFMNIQRPWPG